MPNASESLAKTLPADTAPSSLCILAWMTVQTAALALAALRIPLWARSSAGEFLAVEILVSTQIVMAALLSPRLTADWRATAIAIATAWPFVLLAGLLEAQSASTIVYLAIYISAWLIVLGIWRGCCSTDRAKMAVSAMFATWAGIGPVLLFIRNEYRPDVPPATDWLSRLLDGLCGIPHSDLPQPPTPLPTAVAGPLLNALHLSNTPVFPLEWGSWICLAVIGVTGGGILWVRWMLPRPLRTNYRTAR